MNISKTSFSILIIGVSIFLVSLVFYLLNLFHLSPIFFFTNNGPFFGADTVEISNAMRVPTVDGDMRKHLLFSVVIAPLVNFVDWVFRIGENQAIIVSLGLLSAVNITFSWLILSRFVTSKALAIGLSVTYGSLFSNVIFFSIPETYSLSDFFILGYFSLLLSIKNRNSLGSAAILGTLAGVAGLFNPPLLSLSLVGILYRWRWGELKEVIGYGAMSFLMALLVCCLPYALVHGWENIEVISDNANKYSSLYNLIEIEKIILVCASFFLFSVVSPLMSLAEGVVLNDLLGYLRNPLAMVALIFYLGIGLAAIGQSIRCSDKLVLPIMIWVGVMLIFYVFFNPKEAFLYSSQILFPLTLLVARGLIKIPLSDWYKTYLVLVLAMLLALNNIPVLYR